MTHQSTTTRRGALSLTGTLLLAGLAGCTGSDGGEPAGEDDPTATPTPTGSDDGNDHHDGTEDHHDEGTDEHHDGTDDNHDGTEDHHDEGTDEHHEEGTDDHHDETEDHHEEGTDEHGHNHDEGTPESPSPAAEVAMRTEGDEQHFAPHVVWIEPGGTVTWRLESGSHNAVAYHPDNDKPNRIPEAAGAWSTKLLGEEGATAEHTFETEGVYDYYCTPHEGVGMVGSVIVGEPDAHGQPALEEPQASLPEGARTELADLAETVNEALGHTH